MSSPSQYNWPAIGNERAIEFLEKAIANEKIAQTYVFAGPADLGKSTIAIAFARNLQGNPEGFNSDLHILQAEEGKKNISIEQVREFIKILNLSSFLNSYKIGIIKEAERLTPEAQSALLKTLEEPREKVIVILLVTNEESLPATILSRSQILYFMPVASSLIYDYLIKNYGANRSLAKDLANLSLGRPLQAVRYLESGAEYKDYLEKAEVWLNFFHQDLNTRLSSLDKLFSDKSFSRQAATSALEVLLLGEGLLRDLLLLSLGQNDRVQHSALSDSLAQALNQLETASDHNSGPIILANLKLIAQAKEYLSANVNPRLVLEQVLMNLAL